MHRWRPKPQQNTKAFPRKHQIALMLAFILNAGLCLVNAMSDEGYVQAVGLVNLASAYYTLRVYKRNERQANT